MGFAPPRWTGERIARLGFLVGLGWDANRMAEDPIILATTNNVHRQVQRFGLAFRAAMPALLDGVGPDAAARFQTAAVKRGLSREGAYSGSSSRNRHRTEPHRQHS